MMKRFALAGLLLSLVAAGALMADAPVLINAAGATFPYPVYSKWFDVYHEKNQAIQINYASVGSGAGIAQLTNGTVDFVDQNSTNYSCQFYRATSATDLSQ